MLNGVLLTGNLLLAESLFLCVLYRRRETAGEHRLLSGISLLLEYAVYCAGMIRLSDLIFKGVKDGGEQSVMLSFARVLFAESMSALFLIAFFYVTCLKKARKGCADAPLEGEFLIGLTALLWLTFEGFQEADLQTGFCRQILYLILFFTLEFFRYKRLRFEKELFQKKRKIDQEREEAAYGGRWAEYLKNVDVQYQRTRELWHDLKNHIGVLEILTKEGRYAELSDYLGGFKQDVEFRMIPMQSGCAAVDALLGDKCYCAKRKGVELSIQLCNLSDMELEATDLCVVIGNLLDNALEACGGLPGKGKICFAMKRLEDFYYLTVINPSREPKWEEGRYVSGKTDKENGVGHGLGLRSVERVAHQYGGSLVTVYEEGVFKAIVRMQNGR